MKQVSTEGIILSRTDYGEADRIITFLTLDNGKVRVIAKGVRKPKSKLAGGIELFSVSSITYIVGKSNLRTLISSRLKVHFANIVSDIERTMLGYEMLKITGRALEDEGGEEYYDLLKSSLEQLDTLTVTKNLAEASFLMRLMQLLGHLPNLNSGPKNEPLPKQGKLQFSFDDMAFFESENGKFTQNHVKLLRLLSHNPPGKLVQVTKLENYLKDLLPLIKNMSRQYVVTF